MKSIPTTRLLLWTASAATVVVCVAALIPVLDGRTSPPSYAAEAARTAVHEARAGDAPVWAASAMEGAETELRGALAEYRRQELRLLPLRDFTVVRGRLEQARLRARQAAATATALRQDAEEQATAAIRLAAEEVERAESLAASVPLGPSGRVHLALARTSLSEARYREDLGEFGPAAEIAKRAVEQAERASAGAVSLAERYQDAREVRRWQNWIAATVEASRRSGGPAIVVVKERHVATLYVAGRAKRHYSADMGRNRMAAKLLAGDNATPEGRYHIVAKKSAGQSKYHMALLLDYPNADDRRRLEQARRAGRVSRGAHPGSLIEIHGEGGRGRDWTNGCVALTNGDMADLFTRVPVGTPVTIVGGDGQRGTFSDIARGNGGVAREAGP